MLPKIFVVTYACYDDSDEDLHTESKLFVDEAKAISHQQGNIKSIMVDNGYFSTPRYEEHKNDTTFTMWKDYKSYLTKLDIHYLPFNELLKSDELYDEVCRVLTWYEHPDEYPFNIEKFSLPSEMYNVLVKIQRYLANI